jgi:K+-sensing histidine kinase KdpD
LARHRLAAHFDFVVGGNAAGAVVSVARWRRCGHVFLAQRRAQPWWRWLRGDTLKTLLGLADSLTVLALPEEDVHSIAPSADAQARMARATAP